MTKDLYTEILNTDTPSHYWLLGLNLFESDIVKIHKAGLKQMKKLKAWDLHEDEEIANHVKKIHIQLSRAIAELEDPEKKKKYDKDLADELKIQLPKTLKKQKTVRNIPSRTSRSGKRFLTVTNLILGMLFCLCLGLLIGIPAFFNFNKKEKDLINTIEIRNKEIVILKQKTIDDKQTKAPSIAALAEKPKKTLKAVGGIKLNIADNLIIEEKQEKAFYALKQALIKDPSNHELRESFTRMYLKLIISVPLERQMDIQIIDGVYYLYLEDIPKKLHPQIQTYNSHAYCLIYPPKIWFFAKKYCEKIGGHLVTITNESENIFVKKLMNGTNKIWLGASDYTNKGKWRWVTGEKWEYNNWGKSQPTNYDRISFLSMCKKCSTCYYSTENKQTYEWRNDMKNTFSPFICEWEKDRNKLKFTSSSMYARNMKISVAAQRLYTLGGNKKEVFNILEKVIKKLSIDDKTWNLMKKIQPDYISKLINNACNVIGKQQASMGKYKKIQQKVINIAEKIVKKKCVTIDTASLSDGILKIKATAQMLYIKYNFTIKDLEADFDKKKMKYTLKSPFEWKQISQYNPIRFQTELKKIPEIYKDEELVYLRNQITKCRIIISKQVEMGKVKSRLKELEKGLNKQKIKLKQKNMEQKVTNRYYKKLEILENRITKYNKNIAYCRDQIYYLKKYKKYNPKTIRVDIGKFIKKQNLVLEEKVMNYLNKKLQLIVFDKKKQIKIISLLEYDPLSF